MRKCACFIVFFPRCIVYTLVDCVFYRKWCVQNEINLCLQIEHDWNDQMHLRILSVLYSSLFLFIRLLHAIKRRKCDEIISSDSTIIIRNEQKKIDKNWLWSGRNTIFGQGVSIFLAYLVVNGNILTNGLKWKALISIWWNDFWYGNVMESLAPTFVCYTNC